MPASRSGQEKYKISLNDYISRKQRILKEWEVPVKRTENLLERAITGQTEEMLNIKNNNDDNIYYTLKKISLFFHIHTQKR